jgi:deoxyribodipyrimidine photo-lyase
MRDVPLILWFRRDLRLSDHPMLTAAVATGRPVMPVFILDSQTATQGAAARWRLGLSVADFAARLAGMGLRLVLRSGDALAVLQDLMAETGAQGVYWSRLYDPASRRRDAAVKAALTAGGCEARSFAGHLLHEPWTVTTGEGGFYKVYSPFWRAVQGRELREVLPAPVALRGSAADIAGDDLKGWALGARMQRGAAVVLPWQRVGERAAMDRLQGFLATRVAAYKVRRDFLAEGACSGLSENLTYGEISPLQMWQGGWRALQEGAAGAEHFLKELVWREFAWSLAYNSPHILERNWREGWDDFPWRADNDDAEAWRRGMTGEPLVDAAMRQMYVTGTMHNRARMIVASYLTKHLLTDWRVGQAWFAECLTDWDPASNAMGWQWVAGSGPDAAPYFRIFNPATQAEKFDPEGDYRKRWLDRGSDGARAYLDAAPLRWGLRDGPRPQPLITLEAGRAQALAALAQRKT